MFEPECSTCRFWAAYARGNHYGQCTHPGVNEALTVSTAYSDRCCLEPDGWAGREDADTAVDDAPRRVFGDRRRRE